METGAKEKKLVEWNARVQPVGDVSVKFSSTMGVIVREQVRINIDSWHRVNAQTKETLWTLLMEKSLKMREIRSTQTLLHTLSRKGYSRKEDEYNKLHPDKPLTKPALWTEAHVSKKNTSEANTTKIDAIKKKMEEAPPNDNGEEILTQVLGKEYPGRIRGLGGGVTKTKLYAQSQREVKYAKTEAKLNKMTLRYKKIEAALASKLGITLDDDDSDDADGESGEDGPENSKNKVQSGAIESATPTPTTTPHSRLGCTHQSSINDKCKLINWNGNGEEVAKGSISAVDPKAVVHEYILGPDCYRVSDEEVLVESAEFYRYEPEFTNLADSIGSTIAGPIKYIVLDQEHKVNRSC